MCPAEVALKSRGGWGEQNNPDHKRSPSHPGKRRVGFGTGAGVGAGFSVLTLSSGAEWGISPALVPAVGQGERTAGGQHSPQSSGVGGSAGSPSHTGFLSTGWAEAGRARQSPSLDHQPCSRGSEEEEDSFGGPLTSPGIAKRNPARGHGVEVAQPFSPGTGMQSIREKAFNFPLLGFLLPLLRSSHQGCSLEQRGSQLVLTAPSPPLAPRTSIPRTAGLKYGEHPRARLGLCRCCHHVLRPPRHAPARKKGVQSVC